MICTQFFLNHDESAGIVRCGVHVIYAFLSPTQLSSALGIWMSSTDEYKSEYKFLSETRSPLFSSVRYDGTTTPIIISHLNNGNEWMRLPSLDLDSGSETYYLLFYSSVLDPVMLQKH